MPPGYANATHHYVLCFKIHSVLEANHENVNEDRPILSQQDVAD